MPMLLPWQIQDYRQQVLSEREEHVVEAKLPNHRLIRYRQRSDRMKRIVLRVRLGKAGVNEARSN